MAGVPLLLHQQREARVRAGLATQLAGAINKEVVQWISARRAGRIVTRKRHSILVCILHRECRHARETANPNPAQFCTVGAVPRLYMYREE